MAQVTFYIFFNGQENEKKRDDHTSKNTQVYEETKNE